MRKILLSFILIVCLLYAPKTYLIKYSVKKAYNFDKEINVSNIGLKEGLDPSNGEYNAKILNNLLAQATNKKVILYFPSGNYVVNTLNLKSVLSLTIKGMANNMASYMNRENGDTYSKIIFNSNNKNIQLFKNVNILNLKNIGIYGMWDSKKTGYRTNDDTCKLKYTVGTYNSIMVRYAKEVNIENSEIANFFSAIGNSGYSNACSNIFVDTTKTAFKINVKNSRFSRNIIAISSIKNSNIKNSSFNKNDYAFYLKEISENNNISHNRIEWSNKIAILNRGSNNNDFTYNEFDWTGESALFVYNSSYINVLGNIFRRSGAGVASGDATSSSYYRSYKDRNVHMVFVDVNNLNVNSNITVSKVNSDTGGGQTRPYYVSYFENCYNAYVENNNLTGAKNSKPSLFNYTDGSVSLENNILKK